MIALIEEKGNYKLFHIKGIQRCLFKYLSLVPSLNFCRHLKLGNCNESFTLVFALSTGEGTCSANISTKPLKSPRNR